MQKNSITLLVLVLVVAIVAWLIPQQQQSRLQLEDMQARMETLRTEAQMSRDYVDIANLQATYGYYVDKSRWDDAADLFSDDATLEIAGRGLFIGQDRIREYLHNLGPLAYGRMYNHMQLQPVIHLSEDGATAKARWRALMIVGGLGREARWGEGTYENEYVKERDTWKISKLHSYIGFYVEYDEGWHRGAVELPKPFSNLTPDGEQTVEYGAYPMPYIPPYHYDNPVSGREFSPPDYSQFKQE